MNQERTDGVWRNNVLTLCFQLDMNSQFVYLNDLFFTLFFAGTIFDLLMVTMF